MRDIKFKARCEYHKKNIEVTVRNFDDFADSLSKDHCQEIAKRCAWSRLSEFSGFLDIDDNEIYEHDIVELTFLDEDHPVGLFEVKLMDGHWCISQVSGDFSTCVSIQFLSDVVEEDEIKVVGNLFENSYLVEKKLDLFLS